MAKPEWIWKSGSRLRAWIWRNWQKSSRNGEIRIHSNRSFCLFWMAYEYSEEKQPVHFPVSFCAVNPLTPGLPILRFFTEKGAPVFVWLHCREVSPAPVGSVSRCRSGCGEPGASHSRAGRVPPAPGSRDDGTVSLVWTTSDSTPFKNFLFLPVAFSAQNGYNISEKRVINSQLR